MYVFLGPTMPGDVFYVGRYEHLFIPDTRRHVRIAVRFLYLPKGEFEHEEGEIIEKVRYIENRDNYLTYESF